MRRLNIYFVHSTKFDYNNLIYKKILSSSICLAHNLMLPMTKEYQNIYAKELMAKADIIIAEVSNPSFGLGLELKWLSKVNKPKLFLSLENTIPSKYQKLVPSIKTTDENTYLQAIEDFIKENAGTIEDDNHDNTVILGEI
jgi:hypothetical protein